MAPSLYEVLTYARFDLLAAIIAALTGLINAWLLWRHIKKEAEQIKAEHQRRQERGDGQ